MIAPAKGQSISLSPLQSTARVPRKSGEAMTWKSIFASMVRCEINARYDRLGGWSVSAKGLVAVIVLAVIAGIILTRGAGS